MTVSGNVNVVIRFRNAVLLRRSVGGEVINAYICTEVRVSDSYSSQESI